MPTEPVMPGSRLRQRKIFDHLVTLEDQGVRPPESIRICAAANDTSEAVVRRIAERGLHEDWPLPKLPSKEEDAA